MKQKLIYLLTLICTFVFGLTPVCAQEDVVIEATATYQKNHTVVMDVQLNDEHITSGRVVVGYQGKELSLQKVESKLEWDVKDLLEEGETKKTVAYAYASADEIGKKGTLLHLVFDVNEKMKGKTIPIQVEITELYEGDQLVENPGVITVNVEIPNDSSSIKPMNPDNNQDASNTENVDTGDQSNWDGYLTLIVLSVILMGGAIVYKRKHVHE